MSQQNMVHTVSCDTTRSVSRTFFMVGGGRLLKYQFKRNPHTTLIHKSCVLSAPTALPPYDTGLIEKLAPHSYRFVN